MSFLQSTSVLVFALVIVQLLLTFQPTIVVGQSSSTGSSSSNTNNSAIYPVGVMYSPPSGVWGSCVSYSVHAGTAVSFNGPSSTVATGSVGVAPGTAIDGSYIIEKGSYDLNNAAAISCAADKTTAYNYLHGLNCPAAHLLDSSDLSGRVLLPGVWCFSSLLLSAGTLTLDGGNDTKAEWVFQTSTTLVTSTATSLILINGASAQNVYWAIGSSATLSYDSSFIGQIATYSSVTIGTGCSLVGRSLAGAAVSFAGSGSTTLPVYPGDPIINANATRISNNIYNSSSSSTGQSSSTSDSSSSTNIQTAAAGSSSTSSSTATAQATTGSSSSSGPGTSSVFSSSSSTSGSVSGVRSSSISSSTGSPLLSVSSSSGGNTNTGISSSGVSSGAASKSVEFGVVIMTISMIMIALF